MKRLLVVLLFASTAFALPDLFDSRPVDNSFTGKGSVLFMVNITSADLDANNVKLYVISEDAYNNQEPWETFSMTCENTGNWFCSRNVSFSIAGSDTLEYFYFQANDSSGQNTLGSPSNPLRFRIDRTAPVVTFIRPSNNSYVAGNLIIEISAYDGVSGVNGSLLKYSADGISWNTFQDNIGYINTFMYPDNLTVNIRVNATDNMGNSGINSINVVVDNEAPSISVSSPSPGGTLKDSVVLSIGAGDRYSGLVSNNVSFSIGGVASNMSCTGTSDVVCTYDFNTLLLPDGPYSMVFTAQDNVSNANSSSVPVTIKNSKPHLTLLPEGFVRGIIYATASIANPEGIITGVNLGIMDHGNVSMNCNPSFTSCSYQLDTRTYGDIILYLNASASNTGGYDVSDTSELIIDNTPPVVTIEMNSVVKGPADITARVADTNNNPTAVVFSVLGNERDMSCYMSIPMVCYLNYGFETVIDGRYNISVRSYDYAENPFTAYKEITVDALPPELLSMKIEPLNPTSSTGVMVTAEVADKGSEVKSAYVLVKHGPAETKMDLTGIGHNWTEKFYASASGAYSVDLFVEDMNNNRVNFTEIGYFFMGQLVSCGNGVCDGGENYCLCPSDCNKPSCAAGSVICSSGMPTCSGPLRCGDMFCSVTESCSACPQDCGMCAVKSNQSSSGIGDVKGAAETVYVFASDYTPIFATLVVIAVLLVIVILVIRKKFSPGRY